MLRQKTTWRSLDSESFVWKPHPKQWEIMCDPHRFKFVSAGRRFGKTELAWAILLNDAIHPDTELLWWVASINKELTPASQTIRKITPPDFFYDIRERNKVVWYIQLQDATEIYFHSANTEDSLRGSGLDGLVIDEAGSFPGNRYNEELAPSLIDRDGWLFGVGTPKGRGWFYRMCMRGQDSVTWPSYKSWQFTSYENSVERGGYLNKISIDDIAQGMDYITKRQEIYAHFLKGEGTVFRNIYNCIAGELGAAEPDKFYVTGCDVAKTQDWTVLTAMDNDGHIRGFDRFNTLNWQDIEDRIYNFTRTYPGVMVLDATGVGASSYDHLIRRGLLMRDYKFTNESKANMINTLNIALDQGSITIPGATVGEERVPDHRLKVLVDELEAFEYDILPSGKIRYNAPSGVHDDCVTSLGLAAWGIFSGRVTGGPTASTGRRQR